MQELPPEFRHEPVLGLVAGSDGLDVVRRILAGARRRLRAGGILVCEVGGSAARLVEAYPEIPFTWLDFEHGGDGVFLLSTEQLDALRDRTEEALVP
jgi:ribosomal protein L3 glutamine methyltransferase